jgi:CubicO group peptidase (beta-lactamase class C family)
VDHGRRVRSVDETDGSLYGAHWWIDQLDTARGTFRASGYEGQMVAICPVLDAIVVRLGATPEPLVGNLPTWRKRVFDALS